MLKYASTALLVPPIPFLMIAVLGLLMIRRGIGRALAWFGALALVVLAMPVTGALLMLALEQDLPLSPSAAAPPQAILVLGGDLARAGPDAPAYYPGPLSLERERTAAA